jgi:hypothetical protein
MRNLSPAELRWRPDRPRPAGQSYEYPVEAMRRFAEGERKNNARHGEHHEGDVARRAEAMARRMFGS